jgi:hypothetical protein
MTDNTITIQSGGVEVTLRRRTVLSDSKSQAIINKMALFFVELAAELNEDNNAVDVALSKYANISSQSIGDSKGIVLAEPGDDLKTLMSKSRVWLLDTNPDTAKKLAVALDVVNATWNEPAMSPLLPDNADPS